MLNRVQRATPVMQGPLIAERASGRGHCRALQGADEQHSARAHDQLRQGEVDHGARTATESYLARLIACCAAVSAGSSLLPGG